MKVVIFFYHRRKKWQVIRLTCMSVYGIIAPEWIVRFPLSFFCIKVIKKVFMSTVSCLKKKSVDPFKRCGVETAVEILLQLPNVKKNNFILLSLKKVLLVFSRPSYAPNFLLIKTTSKRKLEGLP